MSYSLNETEAMAKRATRGAGYSWGLAEDAAKAVRRLCANGLDGCGVLADLLDLTASGPKLGLTPLSVTGDWSSTSGRLCPVITGACLSDHANLLQDREIVTRNVLCPALLLPFASSAAGASGTPVSVNWDGRNTVCDATGLCTTTKNASLTTSMRADVRVRFGATDRPTVPACPRAFPDAAVWDRLNSFAHRTYAPATDASRLLGAGAGNTDND